MRIALASIAVVLLALGAWLIALGFIPTGAPITTGGAELTAQSQPTAGPIALGLALLAGGGLLFMLLLRRR